jgi:hypothetical protein
MPSCEECSLGVGRLVFWLSPKLQAGVLESESESEWPNMHAFFTYPYCKDTDICSKCHSCWCWFCWFWDLPLNQRQAQTQTKAQSGMLDQPDDSALWCARARALCTMHYVPACCMLHLSMHAQAHCPRQQGASEKKHWSTNYAAPYPATHSFFLIFFFFYNSIKQAWSWRCSAPQPIV